MLVCYVAAYVFVLLVVDGFMARKFLPTSPIVLRFIGHHRAFASDICADDRIACRQCGVPSTWKLRAEPPRSTRVSTTLLGAVAAQRFRRAFSGGR